jgi:hypothetical protein
MRESFCTVSDIFSLCIDCSSPRKSSTMAGFEFSGSCVAFAHAGRSYRPMASVSSVYPQEITLTFVYRGSDHCACYKVAPSIATCVADLVPS